MKKKGFTLIELLAVIVVLAIISLIATPIVLNIIKSVKKGAFARSAEGVLKASNLYYMERQLELENEAISFNCDDNECVSLKEDENGNPRKLSIDGKMGVGYVNISEEGKVSFKLSREGYCAYKYVGGKSVKVKNGDCEDINIVDDTVPPTITAKGNPITTIDSIMIGYKIEENESGIKEIACKYGSSEGNYDREENTKVSESACSIKNLSKGTYYYQVCVTDYGNNAACITGEATTSDVPTPIIEYKDKDGNNIEANESGYVKKDYITVTYKTEELTNVSNYIKTNVETNAIFKEAGTIQACGNGVNPEECSEEEVTTMSANTWYKVNGSLSITVEFIKEGEVIALTIDENGNTNTNNGVSRHIIPIVSEITFDNTNTESNCEDLGCALDELYEKVGS